ncbi:MAG: GNAT family N-acetyltransferase [Desulfocapsaceae bacterium]|nr:GNAT family N-acetyltransferase [Desulfocapsaceae bacterium]
MDKEISLRKAKQTNLPAILDLYGQPEIDNGRLLSMQEAQIIFARMQTYPNYSMYVAEYQGQVIGTYGLLIMDNLGHLGAQSAIVEDVAISPGLQRRFIGNKMLNYAIELARQAGCYKLMLSTNLKREKAHLFYEKLGLVKHGNSYLLQL